MKTKLYCATYESRNFDFEGVGETVNSAKATLLRVLVVHCRRTGAHLAEFYHDDDVNVREIAAGYGFIDREQVLQ